MGGNHASNLNMPLKASFNLLRGRTFVESHHTHRGNKFEREVLEKQMAYQHKAQGTGKRTQDQFDENIGTESVSSSINVVDVLPVLGAPPKNLVRG